MVLGLVAVFEARGPGAFFPNDGFVYLAEVRLGPVGSRDVPGILVLANQLVWRPGGMMAAQKSGSRPLSPGRPRRLTQSTCVATGQTSFFC